LLPVPIVDFGLLVCRCGVEAGLWPTEVLGVDGKESGVDKGNMLESGEILGVSIKIQVEVSSPPLKFGFGLMTC
jgi:hypothetical protein